MDSYGAREAVEKLQSRCKWDQKSFGEPTCLRVSDALRAICSAWDRARPSFRVVKRFAMDSAWSYYDALHKQVPFESKEPDFGDASVDIVIPSIRDLTFLEVCPWLVFGLSVARPYTAD